MRGVLSDVNYTVTTPCYQVTVLSLERGRLVRGPLVGTGAGEGCSLM